MGNLMPIFIIAGVSLIVLIIIGFIVARMYVKSSSELAFVRTGMGNKKVIKEGGAVVLPVFHQTVWVKLSTLKLSVEKKDDEALITKDRMRVNVTAEFYMRVKPDNESIASAAQTLGDRTQDPEKLRELIEGKFVDALRAVAAEMDMRELHEQRADFVQKVQNNVREDLKKNGLELESVSLTGFDQTEMKYFNSDNAFDAEGLTQLTRVIEERKKERNDIEKDNNVKIEQKNLEAEKEVLEVNKEKEYAKLQQERDIANKTAEENANKAKIQAEQDQLSNEARVKSEKEIKKAQIEASKILEEEAIKKELAIKEAEIEKEKSLEEASIEKEKSVELANQGRDIEVAEKSRAKSEADKQANEALAKAVEAEEKVETARQKEIAERAKEITIIKAEEEAGSDAAKVKVLAQAEKEAAQDRAEAIIIEAKANADAITIQADADERKYDVDAEGKEKLNEAENKLSTEIISMRIKLETVTHLTAIIEASVKPLEKIDAFKVYNVTGLTGENGGNGAGRPTGDYTQGLLDQLLKYRAQAPVIDNIIKELGMGNGLSDIIQNVAGKAPVTVKPEISEKATKSEEAVETV